MFHASSNHQIRKNIRTVVYCTVSIILHDCTVCTIFAVLNCILYIIIMYKARQFNLLKHNDILLYFVNPLRLYLAWNNIGFLDKKFHSSFLRFCYSWRSSNLTEPDTGYRILDTGYRIQDTGYWILDTGYWILDTGYWILDTIY